MAVAGVKVGQGVMSADAVEAALIEAARVWAWGMKAGPSYARDFPAWFYQPGFADRYDPHGDGAARAIAVAVRMPRPDRDMIDRATAAAGWLEVITDDQARWLVREVVTALATGRSRVPWRAILRKTGADRGVGRLQRIYARAIAEIVDAVNGAEIRR